jgi:kynurenine formamidase
MARRWSRRPKGSNWGEFGDDDQLGSLNYITADVVRGAVAEVRDGECFCLSLPLDYPGGRALAPHRFPPQLRSTERKGHRFFNYSFKNEGRFYCDVGCDDAVTLCTQYSTQWDGFAHIGAEFDLNGTGQVEFCFYNGFAADRDIRPPEARSADLAMSLGIDRFAEKAIQSRGVLLDIAHHFGRDAQTIGLSHLLQIVERDSVHIRAGDILCLHTGFADELLKMGRSPDPERVHTMCAALDGADDALKQWLSETRIAALVADNYAVERIEPDVERRTSEFVPLHHHCPFKRGIPLGELWYLTGLAQWLRQSARSAFLLTAPPLRLPGAVGSPVTPVATA